MLWKKAKRLWRRRELLFLSLNRMFMCFGRKNRIKYIRKEMINMRKDLSIIVVFCLVLGLGLVGCAQQKAASSGEAIEASKSMETVEQKVDYLVGQAKVFYNSKDFQQAVDVAQYILRSLDKDSQEAKNLLEKAKEALVAKAQEAVGTATEDVKKKLGSFGQ
jgi:outer membrane PBP1 activator LpoA protein